MKATLDCSRIEVSTGASHWCAPLQVWHECFGMRTDNQSRSEQTVASANVGLKAGILFQCFCQFFGDFSQQTCKICALCKTSSTQCIQRKENNLLSKSPPKTNFLLYISLFLWHIGWLPFCWLTTTVFTVSSDHLKQNSSIFNSDCSKCSVWHHRAEVHKETLEMLILVCLCTPEVSPYAPLSQPCTCD